MKKRSRVIQGFAERLDDEIYKSGMNCVEIGKFIGVDRRSVYDYRDGIRMPNSFQLAKLCVLFNVSSDYLLGLDGGKK